jgi:hypothetical protein
VSSDVHQAGDRRIRPRFGNDRSSIAVSDKNTQTILESNDALRGGNVFLERRQRLFYDADVKAIFEENVVDAFPSRTICPGTVHQNDIPNTMLFALR